MGYKLRRDLREALGPAVTGLQRAVALEIADDANDRTRESQARLEDLARWTGAKDTAVVRNALKRLGDAGWEFRVPIGKGKDGRVLYAVPGLRVTFKVPLFHLPEGVATASPSGEEGATAPSEGATATPYEGEGRATAPSEGATAPSEGAVATPFPSPLTPQRDKEEDAPAVDHHLKAFGAFWLTYPKKKSREDAKRAWIAAMERGANPEHIIDAAQSYARERAQQDPTYTKHPATWLDKGCYDDEPDTAGLGSHLHLGDASHGYTGPEEDMWARAYRRAVERDRMNMENQ